MTDRFRKMIAKNFVKLMDQGVPRKSAMLAVRMTLRQAGLPSSRTQIYAWCRKFKVRTK